MPGCLFATKLSSSEVRDSPSLKELEKMDKRALFCFTLILAVVPCLAKGKKTAVHIKVLKVDQRTEKITPSNKQQTNCVGAGPSISRPGSVSCVGNGPTERPLEETATTYRIEALDASSPATSLTFSCSGVKVTECPPLQIGQQYDAEMDSDSIWVTVQVADGKKTKTVHAHYALVEVHRSVTASTN